MKCPKCKGEMSEHSVDTLSGHVVIDRCNHCEGLWFDHGELDILKADWIAEFLDSGDASVGAKFNKVVDINCPHCETWMASKHHPEQHHIIYEVCEEHGVFMDAGEFTDYKKDNLLSFYRKIIKKISSS